MRYAGCPLLSETACSSHVRTRKPKAMTEHFANSYQNMLELCIETFTL